MTQFLEPTKEEKERDIAVLKQLVSVIPPQIVNGGIAQVQEYKRWATAAQHELKKERRRHAKVSDLIRQHRFMCSTEFVEKLHSQGG